MAHGVACACRDGTAASRQNHVHDDPAQASLGGPDSHSDSEDRSSEDDEDEEADDGDDGDEPEADEDITRSPRWRFLARHFGRWFSCVQYGDHRASTSVDLRFDAFYVFLPYAVEAAATDAAFLQRLRDATELVAYMLELDKNTWWFMRKARKRWFAAFFPSNYDPDKLVPKMTFVLHQRFGPGDDKPGALQRLQYMLVDCARGHDGSARGAGARSFVRAKQRLRDECDPANRLRGFKIPIAFQLRPEEARSPIQLQTYLRDVIALIEAVRGKSERDAAYPFRLDEITLGLHLDHASDAHAELTRLLALGVPVTVRLRHPHTHISLPFAWSDFGWRANVFPAFVGDPAAGPPLHSLESCMIHSSVELLSAVAFSSCLSALEIEPDDERDDAADVDHAKWLAYALRRNHSLASLEMHNFQGTHALLDVMARIHSARDPVRLLASDPVESDEPPQLVRLRPDALIVTPESSGPQSLAQLNIPPVTEFPVVSTCTATEDDSIAIVVPGHAICTAPRSSVMSSRTEPLPSDEPAGLTTLCLRDAYCDRGVVPRFVGLFGDSLEELRWADSLDDGYDEDLDAVLHSCPRLTRLFLQGSSLRSLTPAWLPQLRSLSLMHTAVPMASLVALFQWLGRDDATPALESLAYYCPGHSLDAAAADAALEMLATNRRLESLSVGVASPIYDQYEPRFQDARDVAIQVERLPLAPKLAMCSVVQSLQTIQPSSALGRLDRACLAHIFQAFARHAYRRVRAIQSL